MTLRLFNQWEGWVQPQAKTAGLKGGFRLEAKRSTTFSLSHSCDYLQMTSEIWTVDHPLESELVGKGIEPLPEISEAPSCTFQPFEFNSCLIAYSSLGLLEVPEYKGWGRLTEGDSIYASMGKKIYSC